jgi:hypothetical protein
VAAPRRRPPRHHAGAAAAAARSSGGCSEAGGSAGFMARNSFTLIQLVAASSPTLLLAAKLAAAGPAVHHQQEWSCKFPNDLRGTECQGLHKVAAASTSAACEAACCANGSNCQIWQFCEDATTYCGAENNGCYVGTSTHCPRQQGGKPCTGLDCWQGGCRGQHCPKIPPAPAPPLPRITCGTSSAAPCKIDLGSVGLRFDGIGGITSNGECRLIYDYPEPQRTELLDYLFLPQFGLSTQILKVEIGSDAQSTVGTEPSYQHSEGEISYERGIQFWFMSEAKKRNPKIIIAALEWSAPSWVGNASHPEYGCPSGSAPCAFFTDKNIDYILGWMHGAVNVWNISKIDYVGVWNEPPIGSIPPLWLIDLRASLDSSGYKSTQIIAPDASSTGSQVAKLLDDMLSPSTKGVADAVDVIGTHGYWDRAPTTFTELTSRYPKNAKRAWVSESWHQMGTWNGAKGMVSKVLAAQQQGYSGWTAWGLLFAAYPVTLCQDKGLLYSTQPWAGSYNIQPTVWATAHFTQFSAPGWSWLNDGNGTGNFGNSTSRFATLVNTKQPSQWSTIINNLDSSSAEKVSFAVHDSSSSNSGGGGDVVQLSLFATNETHWFKQLPAPTIDASGHFVLDVAPATVYTISTLSGRDGAQKGHHAHSELAAPFPLPHSDHFQQYPDGRSPKFFTDWDGSFSIVDGVLQQLVMRPPIRWHCTDVDPITLVGPGYSNYQVSAMAAINSSSRTAYVSVCARVQKPFSHWCPSASGYCLKLYATDKRDIDPARWSLFAGRRVIASGFSSVFTPHPRTLLTLRVDGTLLTASINGEQVEQLHDVSFDNGPAALGSGYHYASFHSFEMTAIASDDQPDDDSSSSKVARSTVPDGSIAVGYPVFTGVSLSSPAREIGEFGLAFTPLKPITVTALARFAAAGSTGQHKLSIYCGAVNASQPDARCNGAAILQNSVAASALVITRVNFSKSAADATGMVYALLSSPFEAVVDQQYFLVSEEGAAECSSDRFYIGTTNYPCIGQPGPGGTLPKLDVQIDSVRIDGGVSRGRGNAATWSAIQWDYRPRSFGPLSFAVSSSAGAAGGGRRARERGG